MKEGYPYAPAKMGLSGRHVAEAPIPFPARVADYSVIWSYFGSSFEIAPFYYPGSWFSSKSPESGLMVDLVGPLTSEYSSIS